MELNEFDKELHTFMLARTPTPIAKCGEIVTTTWGSWKKPHKARIYEVGVEIANLNIPAGERIDYPTGWLTLQLYYYANRVNDDGEPVGVQGFVLTNFTTEDGRCYRRRFPDFNHVGLCAVLERLSVEANS